MRIRNWILSIALALGYDAMPIQAQNLVTNSDFESTNLFTTPGVPSDGDELSPGSMATGSGAGVHGWRHFAVYGASGSAFFRSAAQSPFSSGNFGLELNRNSDAGDSAADKGGGLEFEVEDFRVYRMLTDVRTPDPGSFSGTFQAKWNTTFASEFFPSTYTPIDQWETTGRSANAGTTFDGGGSPFDHTAAIGLRILGTGTVHVDNVRLEDVTDPGMTRNVNGGFENGANRLIDWDYFQTDTGVGSAVISGDAASGSQALQLERTAAGGEVGVGLSPLENTGFGIVPGETLEFSFSLKDTSLLPGSAQIAASFEAFDNAAEPFEFGAILSETLSPSDTDYEDYSFLVTVPLLGPEGQVPSIGTVEFQILGDDGSFLIDNVNVTAVEGAAGDFDSDGDVDGADFLFWQQGGVTDPPEAADLATWQSNYGQPSGVSAITAVPEPTSVVLTVIACLCGVMASQRRR